MRRRYRAGACECPRRGWSCELWDSCEGARRGCDVVPATARRRAPLPHAARAAVRHHPRRARRRRLACARCCRRWPRAVRRELSCAPAQPARGGNGAAQRSRAAHAVCGAAAGACSLPGCGASWSGVPRLFAASRRDASARRLPLAGAVPAQPVAGPSLAPRSLLLSLRCPQLPLAQLRRCLARAPHRFPAARQCRACAPRAAAAQRVAPAHARLSGPDARRAGRSLPPRGRGGAVASAYQEGRREEPPQLRLFERRTVLLRDVGRCSHHGCRGAFPDALPVRPRACAPPPRVGF